MVHCHRNLHFVVKIRNGEHLELSAAEIPRANKKPPESKRRRAGYVLRVFRSPSRMTTEAFYDFCCLTHMATELAIAMTKNNMAPSRKLLYEIGIFPGVTGSTNTPIAARARVIKARTVLMIPIQ